jgi:hypothetical protein
MDGPLTLRLAVIANATKNPESVECQRLLSKYVDADIALQFKKETLKEIQVMAPILSKLFEGDFFGKLVTSGVLEKEILANTEANNRDAMTSLMKTFSEMTTAKSKE